MKQPELVVIPGSLSKALKPKATLEEVLARRWRAAEARTARPIEEMDVIPLLAGWIRRLERQAGPAPETEAR